MAKGNMKYEREATEREQARSQGEYDSFLNQFLDRQGTPQSIAAGADIGKKPTGKGAGAFGSVFGAAGGAFGGPGGKGQSGAPVGNGAYTRQDLTESNAYKKMIGAGEEERDYLKSGLRSFAETGGFSPEEFDQMRSYGNMGPAAQAELSDFTDERKRYTDFADTGGYSAPDIQRIRAQAATSAPSLFNSLQQQQNLKRSAMGGNMSPNAGFDMKAARQMAQQTAQDKLGANIGLAESQRAGKQFGIQGLESTGTTMGNQRLQNAGMLNQHNIAQGQMRGDIESRIMEMQNQNKQYGMGALQDLYGQDYAPGRNFEQTWLNAIGAQGSGAQANRGLQLQNDEVNRSKMMENITGLVGAAAGGLTGMGAIGALGGAAQKAVSGMGR